MKTLTNLLAILAVAVLGQSASAVTYLFQSNTPNVFVDQEFWIGIEGYEDPIPVNPTASGQLSVASQLAGSQLRGLDNFGYDKNLHIVTAIEILFAINSDVIEINLGGQSAGNGNVFEDDLGGELPALSQVHDFSFSGSGLSGSLLVNLINTGILDWQLSLTQEQIDNSAEVDLIAASLAVETVNRVSLSAFQGNVPDSASTLGLLCLGVVGLFGFKRRFG